MKRLTYLLLLASTLGWAQTKDVDEGAARQCVIAINFRTGCQEWVSASVSLVDRRVDQRAGRAVAIAHVDFQVLKSFDGMGSAVARRCTGTHWDMDQKRVHVKEGIGGYFFYQGQMLVVRKRLEFEKFESGWRCGTAEMAPIEQSSYGVLGELYQKAGTNWLDLERDENACRIELVRRISRKDE